MLTKDILSHYALDHGVRNPLFFDDEYGGRTRYGSMIGLPIVLEAVGMPSSGGLPGVQQYHAGDDWEYYTVIRPGDQVGAVFRPVRVVEKTGKYAGPMVFQYGESVWMNQRDEVVARQTANLVRTERETAKKKRKYIEDAEETMYTREQLKEIQDLCDRVEIRGATPRYWEDVHISDELPPLVKGPLRLVDIAFYGPGPGEQKGVGAFTPGAHWYVMREFIKYPSFGARDKETGQEQHPHAGHWDKKMAQSLGIPGAYDLGPQRGCWLIQVVLNWMGDDAFIRRFKYELRRFNIEGDTSWIRGKVTDKWLEGRQYIVKCDVWCQDQREKVTASGYIEAVLPSKYPGFEVPI